MAYGNESFRCASRSVVYSHSVENVSPSDSPTMFSTPMQMWYGEFIDGMVEGAIHCLFFQRPQLAGADIIRQFVVKVTGTSIVLPPEAILDCGIGPWPRHDDHIASPKFGAI